MARILVVDADTPIRNLLRAVLEREGYDGVEADNACEGLQQSQAVPTTWRDETSRISLPFDMNVVSTRFHVAEGPCLARGHGSGSLTRMPCTALDDWMFRESVCARAEPLPRRTYGE